MSGALSRSLTIPSLPLYCLHWILTYAKIFPYFLKLLWTKPRTLRPLLQGCFMYFFFLSFSLGPIDVDFPFCFQALRLTLPNTLCSSFGEGYFPKETSVLMASLGIALFCETTVIWRSPKSIQVFSVSKKLLRDRTLLSFMLLNILHRWVTLGSKIRYMFLFYFPRMSILPSWSNFCDFA